MVKYYKDTIGTISYAICDNGIALTICKARSESKVSMKNYTALDIEYIRTYFTPITKQEFRRAYLDIVPTILKTYKQL